MWLNLRFLIAAGLVLFPLAVLAFLIFSSAQHNHEH
jgi:hypothetical protein